MLPIKKIITLSILSLGMAILSTTALSATIDEQLQKYMQEYWSLNNKEDMAGAARVSKQAALLLENNGRTGHKLYPVVLNHTGLFIQRSRSYADSVPWLEKAQRAAAQIHGQDSDENINTLGSLGSAYSYMDEYTKSASYFDQALSIIKQHHQSSGIDFSSIYNNYANMRLRQGQHDVAIPLFNQALSYADTHSAIKKSFSYGQMLTNLAIAYWKTGNLDVAKESYLRAQQSLDKTGYGESAYYAQTLTGLAAIYEDQNKFSQALSIHDKAIKLHKGISSSSIDYAMAINNKGSTLRASGETTEAKALFEQAWAIIKSIGATNQAQALIIKHNVGISHDNTYFGKVDGIKSARQLLKDNKNYYGETHPQTASAYYNLGVSLMNFGESQEAEEMMESSIRIYKATLGDEHQDLLRAYHQFALLYEQKEKYKQALKYIRKASAIQKSRISRSNNSSQSKAAENKRLRSLFIDHIQIIHNLIKRSGASDVLINEAFEAGQLARSTSTATALAQMGARFTSNNVQLTNVLRQHQDLTTKLERLNNDLTNQISQSGGDKVKSSKLKDDIIDENKHLASLEKRISHEFPAYKELTSPLPVSTSDIQKLLDSDEVFLSYVIGSGFTWLFSISSDDIAFHKIEINREGLDNGIGYLREELDPYKSSLEDFDSSLAFQLYERLLSPVQKTIKNRKKLHIVPDGSLQSIPFSLFVTKDPEFGSDKYKDLQWLARTHAISYLPSASSFKLLRTQAGKSKADKEFIGIGDPILNNHPDAKPTANLITLFTARGVADVDTLRLLSSLPETADELGEMSSILSKGSSSLLLRDMATEKQVKSSSLNQYKIIAFATHGLMAGELSESIEPALVLTPPTKGSYEDDGLLTATEVASLSLDADLAILSACNTAASDGSPNAEGFSGLTKAFFYAGARSLLVSHWPVESYSTVQLTTKLLKESQSGVSYSEALRRSSIALMKHPKYGHPYYWAPFVIVGQ